MIIGLEMKKLAMEFRSDNGLGKSEPIRLASLLMKLNVNTFFREIDKNISGISIRINDDKFILINSANPLGRQHFTICHELYHLFYEENFESNICFTESREKITSIEKKADLFASYLLLPEEGILELIPSEELKLNKIQLSTLIKIEQYYSSSRQALLMALKRMKIIDSSCYTKFCKDIFKEVKILGYDTTLYASGNKGKIIGNYCEKAKRLYDSGKISLQNYISILMDAGIEENAKA